MNTIHTPPTTETREARVAIPPKPETRLAKVGLVCKVVGNRLRFIAILVATAFFVGYWDVIVNHWHREIRPDGRVHVTVRSLFGASAARWLNSEPNAVTVDPDTEYFCPMHPSVVRPGLDLAETVPKCPICGMPLSQRKKGAALELPPGVQSRKQYSPQQIQLAGIQTAAVGFQPLTHDIRAVGNVIYDESRLAEITSRVSGYVEKIYVNKTWISVREGDPLAEVYSPELYSSVRELLLAVQRQASSDLVAGSRDKLRLLGVSDSEMDEIVRSGRANHRLVIRSPQSGHIITKHVKQGGHIEPGQTLFEVADLSSIWIEADVFERDIPFLRAGQTIEATVEALPNRMFHGNVSLVHPHLDAMTRTNSIRFEVQNARHELRPGMFATVRIRTPLAELEPFSNRAPPQDKPGEVLAVAEAAVVDTGDRKIVYVERQPGNFEGVEVELGPRSGDHYPVIRGLKPGDRVAAAGAFLIDAETRLNPAAAANYVGAGGGPPTSATRGDGVVHRVKASSQSNAAAQSRAPAPAIPSADDRKNIAKLPTADRPLALAQAVCPVSGEPLGSMGVPHKIVVKGQPVFLCCIGCQSKVSDDPDGVLGKRAPQPATGSNAQPRGEP